MHDPADTNTMTDRPRVLLADDEPDITEPLRFCLEQEGYDVRTASNGYEAIGCIRAWQPHVVLLDVMMPFESGYRVSRLAKEDAKRGAIGPVRIALVTARRIDDQEREEGLSLFSGADRVIYKPFDLDAILALVAELAGRVPAGVDSAEGPTVS